MTNPVHSVYSDSEFARAHTLLNNGEASNALRLARPLLEKYPQQANVLHLMGLCVSEVEGAAIGAAWLRAATRRNPEVGVWHDLATMLCRTNQITAAFDALDRVRTLAPHDILSLLDSASLLRQLGCEADALPFYQEAAKIEPTNAYAQLGMATTLHFMRQCEQAEPYYEAAMQYSENDCEVRWEYAMQNLLRGDFSKGWENYDARLDNSMRQASIFQFDQPLWQGQSLDGKTLLVHGEQGFGDEIMFASILPEIIKQAKRVIIATAPSLVELFQHSFIQATVVPLARDATAQQLWQETEYQPEWLAQQNGIDYQTPIGSLARWCRSSMESFPAAQAYLKPQQQRSEELQTQLREQLNFHNTNSVLLKVGLVWQGNLQTGRMGQRKSIPLQKFIPLAAIPGIQLVSLQLADAEQQIDNARMLRILPFSQHLNNFHDTAALIDNLDLVITVDTGVAHLAAAMGKPTWVLLWRAADWRYLEQATHSHWYSDMRLFRQKEEGKWVEVVQEVSKALASVGR